MRCSKEQCCRDATHVAVEFVDGVLSVPLDIKSSKHMNRFYCCRHYIWDSVVMAKDYTYTYQNKTYKGRIIPIQEWEILRIKSKL